MKGIKFIVLIILLFAGYYVYHSYALVERKISSTSDGVIVEVADSHWEFDSNERLNQSGIVIGLSTNMNGPLKIFSGSVSLAQGEVAAELANKDKNDSLSTKAKQVISRYGCAAEYLNKNTVKFMTIPSNQEVSQTLDNLQRRDSVYFSGQMLDIKSVKYKDKSISEQMKRVDSKMNEIVLVEKANIH